MSEPVKDLAAEHAAKRDEARAKYVRYVLQSTFCGSYDPTDLDLAQFVEQQAQENIPDKQWGHMIHLSASSMLTPIEALTPGLREAAVSFEDDHQEKDEITQMVISFLDRERVDVFRSIGHARLVVPRDRNDVLYEIHADGAGTAKILSAEHARRNILYAWLHAWTHVRAERFAKARAHLCETFRRAMQQTAREAEEAFDAAAFVGTYTRPYEMRLYTPTHLVFFDDGPTLRDLEPFKGQITEGNPGTRPESKQQDCREWFHSEVSTRVLGLGRKRRALLYVESLLSHGFEQGFIEFTDGLALVSHIKYKKHPSSFPHEFAKKVGKTMRPSSVQSP